MKTKTTNTVYEAVRRAPLDAARRYVTIGFLVVEGDDINRPIAWVECEGWSADAAPAFARDASSIAANPSRLDNRNSAAANVAVDLRNAAYDFPRFLYGYSFVPKNAKPDAKERAATSPRQCLRFEAFSPALYASMTATRPTPVAPPTVAPTPITATVTTIPPVIPPTSGHYVPPPAVPMLCATA